MIYNIYGWLHKTAKKFLGYNKHINYRMVNISDETFSFDKEKILQEWNKNDYVNNINQIDFDLNLKDVYPIENIIRKDSFLFLDDTYGLKENKEKIVFNVTEKESTAKWMEFVKKSQIPMGFKNGGLHYAGFILEELEWCLPSWVWTNAAIVRMYCKQGNLDKARNLAEKILTLQEDNGGWVVRNDYNNMGAIPVLAPNDSAYIANNCCLVMYNATHESKYLLSAQKCADWIIKSARSDGMVYIGFDTEKKEWLKENNIVDVGFTAGLFAELYRITEDSRYYEFLKKFTEAYIKIFYLEDKKGFATSVNAADIPQGGMFGRGQAWALEGLIPAYIVTKDEKIKEIINNTIETILINQTSSGGWPYNFSRKLMGVDCKATSVVACSLMKWYKLDPNYKELKIASQKAYEWCIEHTASNGTCRGGIFSYTVEGAIVHHLYTNTAFVYGSSYAIELEEYLRNND